MRKHNILLPLQQSNNDNTPTCTVDDEIPHNNECNISDRNILSGNVEYQFICCSFANLNGGSSDGGAISFTGNQQQTSTSLEISYSSFTECSANDGGAVSASSVQRVSIRKSFFSACVSSSTTDNYGGGALYMTNIYSHLQISNNDFVNCRVNESGGAFNIRNCNENIKGPNIASSCRIIHCIADRVQYTNVNADAGAAYVHFNSETPGFTNCLCAYCHSSYGGAIYLGVKNYKTKSYPIRFCFFDENIGVTGNDLAVETFFSPTDDNCILLDCYSTSNPSRCNYYDGSWHIVNVDWLPSGAVRSIWYFL